METGTQGGASVKTIRSNKYRRRRRRSDRTKFLMIAAIIGGAVLVAAAVVVVGLIFLFTAGDCLSSQFGGIGCNQQ